MKNAPAEAIRNSNDAAITEAMKTINNESEKQLRQNATRC